VALLVRVLPLFPETRRWLIKRALQTVYLTQKKLASVCLTEVRYIYKMTTCEGMKVGDYFEGQYEVSNVVGSSDDGGSKAQFWSEHTGRDFYRQKCGILGCAEAMPRWAVTCG